MSLKLLSFANESSLFPSLDSELSFIGQTFFIFYALLNDSQYFSPLGAHPASSTTDIGFLSRDKAAGTRH
jgi:hypothetical protein